MASPSFLYDNELREGKELLRLLEQNKKRQRPLEILNYRYGIHYTRDEYWDYFEELEECLDVVREGNNENDEFIAYAIAQTDYGTVRIPLATSDRKPLAL